MKDAYAEFRLGQVPATLAWDRHVVTRPTGYDSARLQYIGFEPGLGFEVVRRLLPSDWTDQLDEGEEDLFTDVDGRFLNRFLL